MHDERRRIEVRERALPGESVTVREGEVLVTLRPFQILTLRLSRT